LEFDDGFGSFQFGLQALLLPAQADELRRFGMGLAPALLRGQSGERALLALAPPLVQM
jgi:hypothetical protein